MGSDGSHKLLEEGCVGLGMFRDIPSMNVGRFDVPMGGVLCCYTDGLVEQENDMEVPFGTDRLLSMLAHHQGQSLEAVHRTIVAASLDAFRGDEPPLDDTAMLTLPFFLSAPGHHGRPSPSPRAKRENPKTERWLCRCRGSCSRPRARSR